MSNGPFLRINAFFLRNVGGRVCFSVSDLRLSGLPHKKALGRYSGSINEQARTVIYFLTGKKNRKEPCGAI